MINYFRFAIVKISLKRMSSSNNGKNTAIAILSALLLFLAGAAIWLLFSNKSQVKENQETLGKISSIQNQLTDLESDNAKLIVELDTKGSENEMLRGEVESLRFQLEEAKSMLKNLSARAIKSPGSVSNQEIESARNMIRELVAQRDKFLASLDSVSSLTQSYSQQAQVVTVEKEKLQTIEADTKALALIENLGLNAGEAIEIAGVQPPAKVVQDVIERKWKLSPRDKDLLIFHHDFEYELEGESYQLESSLVVKGENQTDTAMSKCVGLPMAIFTKLFLTQGFENLTGVQIPTMKQVYEPVLKELKACGIQFVESK